MKNNILMLIIGVLIGAVVVMGVLLATEEPTENVGSATTTEPIAGDDTALPTDTAPNSDTHSDEPADTPAADDEEVVACTMDAKQCPDGSFVGRVAPDCEFAACPVAEEPVYCAQDVKECPDGSYVGREAPDCEFAACPHNSGSMNLQLQSQ